MLPRKQPRRKFAMRTFTLVTNSSAPHRKSQSEDNNLYRQLFDLTHVIKLIIDPTTYQIIDANPAACQFYGYSRAQLQSMTLRDIKTMSENEFRAMLPKILAGEVTTFQARHRLASGEIRDVEIQAGFLSDGKSSYLYSVIQDITARKQLENALRESEQLYRLFAQNMPATSVAMYDTNMRYILAEGSLFNRLGAVVKPVVGELMEDCITSKEVAQFIIPICERALRGESFSYEREQLDYAYQAYVSPIRDSSGTIIGGMVLAHDITERKQLENDSRIREEQLRLITDNMQDIVTQLDAEDRVVYASSSSRAVLGVDAADMIGKSPQEFFHPDDRAAINILQEANLKSGKQIIRGESRLRHADGHYVDVETTGKILYDDEGNYLGGIYATRDITERKRLEAALRASEEQMRVITDNMQDVVSRIDAEDVIRFSSASSSAVFGYAPEEMIGKAAQDILHPDDCPVVNAIQQASIKAGKTFMRGEARIRHAGGHYIDVETIGKLLYDDQGNFLEGIYVAREITERKRLEAAFRTSEERLRLITDNMQDLVILVNEKEEIVYVSPSIQSVMGYDTTTIVGTAPSDATHPDDRERIFQTISAAMLAHHAYVTVEARLRHADGHYNNFEVVCRMLYDDQSNFSGAVFVARDITERKRLEAALHASEERLRLITDNVEDLILLTSPQREAVYFSPSFTRVLDYDADFLHTKMPVEFVHPDDRQRVGAAIQKVFDGQESQVIIELRVSHSDGHYISFEDVFRPLYDPDARLTGILHVFRDITSRKQMEDLLLEKQKLQTALDKEQELSTIKTRMMERISHEFRTPLAVIQVATETLTHYHHRLTDENRQAKNATVQSQIRRITDMLDEMALVLRSTVNANRFYPTSTNLSNLCREITAELATSFGLPGKYQLELQPDLIAPIDSAVLRDGLTHIMRNAARFSEPDEPVIIRLAPIADCIELRIIDHGIGIPPDEVAHIFEPFYRGSNISERGGLGVGLTIARAAIEAHDGTIRVESKLDKGTTFIITLRA